MRLSALAKWLLAACSLASFAGTCATTVTLRKDDQGAAKSRFEGKRLFLRSSMYYGPFFGDRKAYLIATRKFADLRLIEDLDGVAIPPGKEEGIVPAGREVLVEKVEFPPAERPLLTPRFYPWVYMKIDKTFTDRPHILVLQPNVDTLSEFEQLLATYLADKDPRPAIDTRPSAVRQAIDAKEIVEGMTGDEVMTSLGPPDEIRRGSDKDGRLDLWVYPRRCVQVREGKTAAAPGDGCR